MRVRPLCLVAALACSAAGCAGLGRPPSIAYEDFGSTDLYSRHVDATEARACEAARRGLLSQGYVVTAGEGNQFRGRKNFPASGTGHVQIEMQVVCASDGAAGAIVFASALQDRYEVKKTSSSASLGIGVLGSVSLPFSESSDSLVRVASETISSERFYDGFFSVLRRFLDGAEAAQP